jgi:hypothetical protein
MHSGKVANQLRLETHGWTHEVDLRGEEPVDVLVPASATGGAILLDLVTSTGFVPIEVDPAVRDRRNLGVWIVPAVPLKE